MLLEDYNRFLDEFSKELPSNLKVIKEGQTTALRRFAKVHDINTTFIPHFNIDVPGMYYGIFVDIMPLKGVPVNVEKYARICNKLCEYDGFQKRNLKEIRGGRRKKLLWHILFPEIELIVPQIVL